MMSLPSHSAIVELDPSYKFLPGLFGQQIAALCPAGKGRFWMRAFSDHQIPGRPGFYGYGIFLVTVAGQTLQESQTWLDQFTLPGGGSPRFVTDTPILSGVYRGGCCFCATSGGTTFVIGTDKGEPQLYAATSGRLAHLDAFVSDNTMNVVPLGNGSHFLRTDGINYQIVKVQANADTSSYFSNAFNGVAGIEIENTQTFDIEMPSDVDIDGKTISAYAINDAGNTASYLIKEDDRYSWVASAFSHTYLYGPTTGFYEAGRYNWPAWRIAKVDRLKGRVVSVSPTRYWQRLATAVAAANAGTGPYVSFAGVRGEDRDTAVGGICNSVIVDGTHVVVTVQWYGDAPVGAPPGGGDGNTNWASLWSIMYDCSGDDPVFVDDVEVDGDYDNQGLYGDNLSIFYTASFLMNGSLAVLAPRVDSSGNPRTDLYEIAASTSGFGSPGAPSTLFTYENFGTTRSNWGSQQPMCVDVDGAVVVITQDTSHINSWDVCYATVFGSVDGTTTKDQLCVGEEQTISCSAVTINARFSRGRDI